MNCNKCGEQQKSGVNFCTKCGNQMEQRAEEKSIEKENKYTTKIGHDFLSIALVGVMGFGAISTFFMGELFYSIVLIISAIALYSTFKTTNLLFNCPNCNEEITLNTTRFKLYRYKCPKCTKELLFNHEKSLVTINNSVETDRKVESNNVNKSTDKLEELYNLKSKGIITEEEFEKKKQELLDKI